MQRYSMGPPPTDAKKKLRYGWFRAYEDIGNHKKWRLVSRRANVPIAVVIATVLEMLCIASKARPKGSIQSFRIAEYAEYLGVDDEEVARVRATLESDEIGWLDGDWIVDWFDRQPESEDPTATLRQQRKRAIKRIKEKKLPPHIEAEIVERMKMAESSLELTDLSRVTPVTSRNVTIEQNRNIITSESVAGQASKEDRSFHSVSGRSGDIFPDLKSARSYLWGTGTSDLGRAAQVVAAQMGVLATTADKMVLRRWHQSLSDEIGLAKLIVAADVQAIDGQHFENLVVQGIERLKREAENGPSLPLPVVGIRKSTA